MNGGAVLGLFLVIAGLAGWLYTLNRAKENG